MILSFQQRKALLSFVVFVWSTHNWVDVVVYSLDLKALSLERVEIILRVIPNEKEVKAYKEYDKMKKPVEVLSEEDKFMAGVSALDFNTVIIALVFIDFSCICT